MTDKARIAVMVSGTGTNLQALIDAQNSGLIEKGEIVLVISNREDAYALERARKAGIEAFTITRKASGGQEGFEEACCEIIDSRNIALIVLAGFLMILSKDFVTRYDHKIIAQKAVSVEEGDTPEILQRRVMEQAEWLILPVAVAKICRKIVKERHGRL